MAWKKDTLQLVTVKYFVWQRQFALCVGMEGGCATGEGLV